MGQHRGWAWGLLWLAVASAPGCQATLAESLAADVASGQDVRFPAGFWWGAATAAHQVEGQLSNDWSASEAGHVRDGATSQVGVDHYRRFDQDFALAQAMGHNAHRLSIEWSRLEPTPGAWDPGAVAHYHEVLRALRARGLRPVVTLLHFTAPNWVAARGGWLDDRAVTDFERFAHQVGREFGAEVDDWITINEPNVYAFKSYDEGSWPPFHHERGEALQVMARLVEAHARAYRALHATDTHDADGDGPPARVGIAQHLAIFDPERPWHPLDQVMTYFNDRIFNRAFLAALTTGDLDFSLPGTPGITRHLAAAAGTMDFVGINYYTRWLCRGTERLTRPGAPTNDLGWELYPEGMLRALRLAGAYATRPDGVRLPIYVTENGMDDRRGTRRDGYLVQHLAAIAQARREGLDVRGYLHWTLMDNFEWVEGYLPRFGLYQVDRRPGKDLERIPTPTVALFRRIAQANALPAAVLQAHEQLPGR